MLIIRGQWAFITGEIKSMRTVVSKRKISSKCPYPYLHLYLLHVLIVCTFISSSPIQAWAHIRSYVSEECVSVRYPYVPRFADNTLVVFNLLINRTYSIDAPYPVMVDMHAKLSSGSTLNCADNHFKRVSTYGYQLKEMFASESAWLRVSEPMLYKGIAWTQEETNNKERKGKGHRTECTLESTKMNIKMNHYVT